MATDTFFMHALLIRTTKRLRILLSVALMDCARTFTDFNVEGFNEFFNKLAYKEMFPVLKNLLYFQLQIVSTFFKYTCLFRYVLACMSRSGAWRGMTKLAMTPSVIVFHNSSFPHFGLPMTNWKLQNVES